MDDFSVFTLSWSARYRRFHTAASTSPEPSKSPSGDGERGWEELGVVGMSAISGEVKQQEV